MFQDNYFNPHILVAMQKKAELKSVLDPQTRKRVGTYRSSFADMIYLTNNM